MEAVLADWLQEAVDKGREQEMAEAKKRQAQAVAEAVAEATKKTAIETTIKTARGYGASRQAIVENLMECMDWDEAKAKAVLEKYDETGKIDA